MRLGPIGFWICVVMVVGETLYGYYWAIPNIAVRLGIWPHSIHPGLYDIIPTLTWWQEAAFFSHVAINTVVVWALLRRWVACIILFTLSFLLDRIDWIVMGLNPLSTARNDAAQDWITFMAAFGGIGFSAIMQIIAIMIMAMMLQNGQLTAKPPDDLLRLLRRFRR